jgi:ribonuclease-3
LRGSKVEGIFDRVTAEESANPLHKFLETVGVTPNNIEIFEISFTHSSFLNEQGLPSWEGNERLEFLGDAVIGLAVTEALYEMYPREREGMLSKIKAVTVSRATLARHAARLGLGDYLRLGVGEAKAGGQTRQSIQAAIFESLVGAIYLDQGFESAMGFVLDQLIPVMRDLGKGDRAQDHKSRLQELAQRVAGQIPRYRVVESGGPDHDKWFAVEVSLRGGILGHGEGASKKSAEQSAAKSALDRIEENDEGLLSEYADLSATE